MGSIVSRRLDVLQIDGDNDRLAEADDAAAVATAADWIYS